MTNWIAANLVSWFFDVRETLRTAPKGEKVGYIRPTSSNGVETLTWIGQDISGMQVNGGILIAILIAVPCNIIMSKTTFGYQLKACGSNRHAAKYAGINDKLNIIYSMAIAEPCRAAGASTLLIGQEIRNFSGSYQALPAEGFNGIPVALLASNNPVRSHVIHRMFQSIAEISS